MPSTRQLAGARRRGVAAARLGVLCARRSRARGAITSIGKRSPRDAPRRPPQPESADANPHLHPPLEKDMDAGDAKKLASFYAPSVAELYRMVAHEPKLRLIGGSLEDPHWLETSVVMQPNIAATAALAAAATNGGGAAMSSSAPASPPPPIQCLSWCGNEHQPFPKAWHPRLPGVDECLAAAAAVTVAVAPIAAAARLRRRRRRHHRRGVAVAAAAPALSSPPPRRRRTPTKKARRTRAMRRRSTRRAARGRRRQRRRRARDRRAARPPRRHRRVPRRRARLRRLPAGAAPTSYASQTMTTARRSGAGASRSLWRRARRRRRRRRRRDGPRAATTRRRAGRRKAKASKAKKGKGRKGAESLSMLRMEDDPVAGILVVKQEYPSTQTAQSLSRFASAMMRAARRTSASSCVAPSRGAACSPPARAAPPSPGARRRRVVGVARGARRRGDRLGERGDSSDERTPTRPTDSVFGSRCARRQAVDAHDLVAEAAGQQLEQAAHRRHVPPCAAARRWRSRPPCRAPPAARRTRCPRAAPPPGRRAQISRTCRRRRRRCGCRARRRPSARQTCGRRWQEVDALGGDVDRQLADRLRRVRVDEQRVLRRAGGDRRGARRRRSRRRLTAPTSLFECITVTRMSSSPPPRPRRRRRGPRRPRHVRRAQPPFGLEHFEALLDGRVLDVEVTTCAIFRLGPRAAASSAASAP